MVTWPSDETLQNIIDSITSHFGEDMAQECMVVLGLAVQRGVQLENPFAFCWGVAENKLKHVLRDRDNGPEILYVNQHEEWTSASTNYPDALLDWAEPERIVQAREILNTLPIEYVMDTPMSPDEKNWQEPVNSSERSKRTRIKQRIKTQYDM